MLALRICPKRRGAAPSRALGLARLALVAAVADAVLSQRPRLSAATVLPQDAFQQELTKAERALSRGAHEEAEAAAVRALERDGRNPRAWAVRAAIATASGDEDLATYCLHRELRLIETLAASDSLPARSAALSRPTSRPSVPPSPSETPSRPSCSGSARTTLRAS